MVKICEFLILLIDIKKVRILEIFWKWFSKLLFVIARLK